MIFDELKNCELYYSMNKNFKKAFEFLKNTDLENLADGSYEIEGKNIYANVQSLETKPKEDKKWEAHKKYIDIQYVIKGAETMGVGFKKDFNTNIEYDDKKDVEFLDGEKHSYINVSKGEFAIFYPNDVHAPMLRYKNIENIKKVIVKIIL